MAFAAAALLVVVLGVLLGAVHREFAEPGVGVKVGKGLGIAMTSVGTLLVILSLSKPTAALSWEREGLDKALARASSEKRPMLIDFTADWCLACKELDAKTFSEARVGQELGRFVAVKVDATNNDDPRVAATMTRFKVVGLPTVVLFDSRGQEAMRFNDFVPPDEFLKSAQRVD